MEVAATMNVYMDKSFNPGCIFANIFLVPANQPFSNHPTNSLSSTCPATGSKQSENVGKN
jgi:hypothetical protein